MLLTRVGDGPVVKGTGVTDVTKLRMTNFFRFDAPPMKRVT
jgi:hypothetical protein